MTTEELVRHILPSNATPFERAAAETLFERLEEIPMIIDTIWTPAGCPVELLPFLAWAVSVDVWDDNWPEQVKRDVIAAAPTVHRKKGTLLAVETSLKALGIRSEVTEWWQKVPEARRGTFEITAYANIHLMPGEVILSEEVQLQVMRQIQASKAKTRAFTFQVGADFSGEITAANGMAGSLLHRDTITADRDGHMQSGIQAANAVTGCAVHRHRVGADRNGNMQSGVSLANGFGVVQYGHFTCEAAP